MYSILSIKGNFKWLMMSAVGLLSPIKYLLILVGIFIIIDTVLGIWNAKKQKIKITSSKLSAVLSKMFVYQGIVILAYAIDTAILGGIVSLFVDTPLIITKLAALLVMINEGFSIDEKVRSLNNERGTWFYFKRALGVAKFLKKETKDLVGDDDDKPKLEKDDSGDLIG